ncbi:MAG: AMP-binding protein [Lachnospiraceae bacterium]|nr:AMP-binding protein [Lachnospiraceae bacterium]
MKTIAEIWDHAENSYPELAAVKWLEKKEIKERTYKELGINISLVKKGLKAAGFEGSHISLIGTSSVWWMEAYLAITTGNNIAVPLDAGLPVEDLLELLNRADCEALFISPKLKGMIDQVKTECPKIKKIWLLQEDDIEGFETIEALKVLGKDKENVTSSSPDDVATIIYTSGTTGKSKGVMLSERNLAENVANVPFYSEPGCQLMTVLPIHHCFCLVMNWLMGFSLGASICINDSFMHMVRNMSIYKPKVMLMVPLMIETIYKRLAAADQSIPKKAVADSVFGGNLEIIFTGGAHLDPFYVDSLKEYGVSVLEGYGMSECSPVISSNMPDDHKVGSIGRPLKNAEIRFENGEILVKGSSVMKGYYKMPKETEETLKDGWLHTGDKGYIDEDGFLFINGRVKNLIILSNGENISPEEIENKLALEALVGEIVVTGENNGLTARIYPDQEVVAAKGLSGDTLKAELQAAIDKFNVDQPTYKKIVGLVVRNNPFHRNATGKIKRTEAEIDD